MQSILICDDNRDIVEALKIYLGAEGYTLYTAANGAEALDIVQNHSIQLILIPQLVSLLIKSHQIPSRYPQGV